MGNDKKNENPKSELTPEERSRELWDTYNFSVLEIGKKTRAGKMDGTCALASLLERLQSVIEKDKILSERSGGGEEIVITFQDVDISDIVERLVEERLAEERGRR